MASADFLSGIRDLKNAVSDVSSGTKEVSSLTSSLDLSSTAAAETDSAGELATGDLLSSKINKLKVFQDPSKSSASVSEANKTSDLIFMGEETNGFYHVTTDDGTEGWVQKVLVGKR